MTVIDGYDRWTKPACRTRDEHAGRGPILLTVFAACLAFWALLGYAVSQI